ncbi:MAG: Mu transposase C-terminal domain-containing protein [Rhodobacteraceae bacterium]|nr:Mu transposase C-terminal domain-containing protein [Paracoccaceae bacterium]
MLDFSPSPQTPNYAFGKYDTVTISDVAYRMIDATDAGYVFRRLDGEGVAISYTRSEMARMVSLGRVSHERNALLPLSAKARLEMPEQMLSSLPPSKHAAARGREAVVRAFLDLERQGKVKRTDASITAENNAITGAAAKILKSGSEIEKSAIVPDFSARSLRRWLAAFERRGVGGLFDHVDERGYRKRRLCPQTLAILTKCVNGYMSELRPTQAAIYNDVRRAIRNANEERRMRGEPDLACPTRETVRQEILRLDPYLCDLIREGADRARMKHAPVGTGLDLTRPLERVEIDTCRVDVLTLMTASGLLEQMSEKERRLLGLTGSTKRWFLTVAICATTRCILGMKLSRTANTMATIQVLDMIMQDKGVWTDAVGALTPWHMHGKPELIVTDLGPEYAAYDVQIAASDLGIPLMHAPGGLPEMRARIESFFRTMSINLMERLSGRTFSNSIQRGDYDSKGRAALTADDFCEALTRWVADIYHRRMHSGLDGETPANCWDRLTARYGAAPGADLRRRRMAFGTRMERTVQKDGITVLGVRYHSDQLAAWFPHMRDNKMKVRWYSEDIGAIAVELNGKWIDVPSVFARFRGVRAQTWNMARAALAARYKQEAALDEDVVFQAISDIEAINGNAMRRIGLLTDYWTPDRIDREEARRHIGFRIEPSEGETDGHRTEKAYGEEFAVGSDHDHGFVNEFLQKSPVPVSGPVPTTAGPTRAEHRPDQDDDPDEPEFEIGDK